MINDELFESLLRTVGLIIFCPQILEADLRPSHDDNFFVLLKHLGLNSRERLPDDFQNTISKILPFTRRASLEK